jgi:hypothetical protein
MDIKRENLTEDNIESHGTEVTPETPPILTPPALAKPDGRGAKEHFYDKVPLTLKQLNVIIVILIIAIILFLTFGSLIGNGVIP